MDPDSWLGRKKPRCAFFHYVMGRQAKRVFSNFGLLEADNKDYGTVKGRFDVHFLQESGLQVCVPQQTGIGIHGNREPIRHQEVQHGEQVRKPS